MKLPQLLNLVLILMPQCMLMGPASAYNNNDYNDADDLHKAKDHSSTMLHYSDSEKHNNDDDNDLLLCACIHIV